MQITIKSITDSGSLLKIVDSEDKKYNLWKEWEGTETPQYSHFRALGLRSGVVTNVEYKEKDKTFTNKEGKNIKYKERTIIAFNDGKLPNGTSPTNAEPEAKYEATEPLKPRDYRWEAIGKTASILIAAEIGREGFNSRTGTVGSHTIDDYFQLATMIVDHPKPEEVDLSNIPF